MHGGAKKFASAVITDVLRRLPRATDEHAASAEAERGRFVASVVDSNEGRAVAFDTSHRRYFDSAASLADLAHLLDGTTKRGDPTILPFETPKADTGNDLTSIYAADFALQILLGQTPAAAAGIEAQLRAKFGGYFGEALDIRTFPVEQPTTFAVWFEGGPNDPDSHRQSWLVACAEQSQIIARQEADGEFCEFCYYASLAGLNSDFPAKAVGSSRRVTTSMAILIRRGLSFLTGASVSLVPRKNQTQTHVTGYLAESALPLIHFTRTLTDTLGNQKATVPDDPAGTALSSVPSSSTSLQQAGISRRRSRRRFSTRAAYHEAIEALSGSSSTMSGVGGQLAAGFVHVELTPMDANGNGKVYFNFADPDVQALFVIFGANVLQLPRTITARIDGPTSVVHFLHGSGVGVTSPLYTTVTTDIDPGTLVTWKSLDGVTSFDPSWLPPSRAPNTMAVNFNVARYDCFRNGSPPKFMAAVGPDTGYVPANQTPPVPLFLADTPASAGAPSPRRTSYRRRPTKGRGRCRPT